MFLLTHNFAYSAGTEVLKGFNGMFQHSFFLLVSHGDMVGGKYISQWGSRQTCSLPPKRQWSFPHVSYTAHQSGCYNFLAQNIVNIENIIVCPCFKPLCHIFFRQERLRRLVIGFQSLDIHNFPLRIPIGRQFPSKNASGINVDCIVHFKTSACGVCP